MPTLSPYLFSHNAREQATFYAEALQGEILDIRTFAEAPQAVEDQDKVMHLQLMIGTDILYMADYTHDTLRQGNAMDLILEFDTEEEGREAFENLALEGEVLMPYEPVFWGMSFGRLIDQFGVRWQIAAGGR